MKIKFNPDTILPHSITKGSVSDRNRLAEHYTNMAADKLAEKFPDSEFTEYVDPQGIYDCITSVLPAKIKFVLTQNYGNNSFVAPKYLNNGKSVSLDGYQLCVPWMYKEKIATFVHEVRHLMDYITKPAYSAKIIGLRPEITDDVVKIYNKNLYTQSKFTGADKKELKVFLSKYPAEDRIVILNFFRAMMRTEVNAYNQELSYVNKLDKLKFGYIMSNYSNKYKFEEKIKFIEDMLGKTIMRERSKMRIKHFFRAFFKNKPE